jgi:2-polyprenyl-3-methyl-5-hydroxy-6-metoxy-1,4-benzoquinol methylase
MGTKFIRDRDRWLLERCKNKRVLHLGCTDWPITEHKIKAGRLLHLRLAAEASLLVGVDPDASGIQKLSELMPGFTFVRCKAEDMRDDPQIADQQWDIILAADMVEHVSNVGLTLNAISDLMSSDTELILTTPSAHSLKWLLVLGILGKELVHPDHCYYFSESTLRQILRRSGLEMTGFSTFMWKNPSFKSRLLSNLFFPINIATGGRVADELAVVARKSGHAAVVH